MLTWEVCYHSPFKGSDYYGNDSHCGLVPEKIMVFDYTYEYQEDVNAKIVEENRKATEQTLVKIERSSKESSRLALTLFAISIFVSVVSLIISMYPKQFKPATSKFCQYTKGIAERYRKYRNRKKQKSKE